MDNYTATELAYKNGYESGLDKMQSIIDVIYHQQMTDIENGICKAVLDVGINVDKERLTRAIEDARSFYAEGYSQGKKDACAWISIEDRLPPFHTDLLVVSDGKVYTAKEMLTWEDGHSTVYIPMFNRWKRYTHWMLIPELPNP